MVKRSKSFLQEPSEITPKAVMTMVCWTLTVAVWLPFPFPVKKLQALLIIILLALGFSQKMLTVYINFLTVLYHTTLSILKSKCSTLAYTVCILPKVSETRLCCNPRRGPLDFNWQGWSNGGKIITQKIPRASNKT